MPQIIFIIINNNNNIQKFKIINRHQNNTINYRLNQYNRI